MSPPCWRSYMLVSTSRTIGYEISPAVSANSGMGPTLIIWCTMGVSGSRAPAIRAIRGLHTPQQITQMPVSMSPAVVRTARTAGTLPPSAVSMPRTSVPASTCSAPDCCASSRMRVPARSESTTPTVGKCAPPRITDSSRYGTSLRTSAGDTSCAGIPHALAAVQRRRSSAMRSAVRATSIPPLWVNTPSAWYCSVLSRVSSIIIFEYSIGKTKLEACPVEPPGFGIGPLSTRTRSRHPSRARWQARLLPTMPAPMITALARAGVSVIRYFPPISCFPVPPGTDPAPPPGLLAAGPGAHRARRCVGLLDRDLLVDQTKVDALPAADDPRTYEDHDGQHVHGTHVDQRSRLVHEVQVVGEPLDEVEDQQPDRDNAGHRDDWHPEHLDLARWRGPPQLRFAPWQDDHRDRAEQVGHRDDQRRVQRVRDERRVVRVQGGQPDRRQQHQEQRIERHFTLLRHLGRPVGQHPVERRGEDDPGRGQEQRAHPAEEPQAQYQDEDDLERGVVHQPAREHELVRPDAELRGEVVVQRVEVLVEAPAHRLGHQQQEDDRERHGDPQAGEHAGEDPPEVAGAADLAV